MRTMVTLFWDANDFGLQSHAEVSATYATVEDAVRQAEHDMTLGRHPLRVEEDGNIVWTPET